MKPLAVVTLSCAQLAAEEAVLLLLQQDCYQTDLPGLPLAVQYSLLLPEVLCASLTCPSCERLRLLPGQLQPAARTAG